MEGHRWRLLNRIEDLGGKEGEGVFLPLFVDDAIAIYKAL